MSSRVNRPAKTLVLLVGLAGLAWAAYEFVYVRGIFRTSAQTHIPREELDQVRLAILDAYQHDRCFLELGPVHYRGREDRYRVDIVVADGCEEYAKTMCSEIADLVRERIGREAEVWAYTSSSEKITRYLP